MSSLRPTVAAPQHTQILSLVTTVDAASNPVQVVSGTALLHAELSDLRLPFEIVMVVNGGSGELLTALRQLAAELSDLQFYALQYPVDRATALLAGLENAVGDWVATFDLESDRASVFAELFRAVQRDNAEIGLARPEHLEGPRGLLVRLLSPLFHRLFRSIHGFALDEASPSLRLLSRTVVNAILQSDAPLVAFDTLAATSGYAKTLLPTAHGKRRAMGLGDHVRARWRVLIGLNAVPLRLANGLCGLGALLAALYSLYAVVVYFFKHDVVPGWTTLSLMMSSLFFLMAVVLGLLSEYMIMLLDTSARRPRYHTASEFASRHQTRRQALNVETSGES